MKNIMIMVSMACFCSVGTGHAQHNDNLEKRIRILEEKVANLEAIINLRTLPETATAQQTDPRPATMQRKPPAVSQPAPQQVRAVDISKLIRARLFKKTVEVTGYGKTISFLVAFTNTSRENIRGFKGTIILYDVSGTELISFVIALDKPIASYDSESWFGEVPFDAGKPGYTRVEMLEAEAIQTTLVIDEVVFADGKTMRRE